MSQAEQHLLRLSDALFEISKSGWQELTAAERIFMLVWELEAEVNNGGFHQYFLNSASALAPEVSGALRSIGAENTAAIVDQALAVFAGRFAADRDARIAVLEEIDPDLDRFDDLDQAFYSYPDDLSALLFAFAIAHAPEIRGGA